MQQYILILYCKISKFMILFYYKHNHIMNTVNKSPEAIQAQIASFTAEQVLRQSDQECILRDIGMLAVHEPTDIYGAEKLELQEKPDGSYEFASVATDEKVAAANDYTAFVTETGGMHYAPTAWRAGLLHNFKDFAPAVAALEEEVGDRATQHSHHRRLPGQAHNSMVFPIEHEGQEYVVRMSNDSKGKGALSADGHMMAGQLAQGISGLEQIVAASYEKGVTVATRVPGKPIENLTADDMNAVTQEQANHYVESVMAGHRAGIEFDNKKSNILYDRAKGYGIVDLSVVRPGHEAPLGEVMAEMIGSAQNAGAYYRREPVTPQEFAQSIALYESQLNTLNKFREAADEKLAGDDRQQVLADIATTAAAIQKNIVKYSNPSTSAPKHAHSQPEPYALTPDGYRAYKDDIVD